MADFNSYSPGPGSFGQQALGALKQAGLNAIGGLPGFAFSTAGSLINSALANRSAKLQYERQLDFWQNQNEYNSPANQRKLLEQAGLNPVAAAGQIAGNGAAGALSSVPGNNYAQNGVFDTDALQNSMMAFATMEQIGANTDQMRKQIELSIVEKMIRESELFGIDLDNDQKQILLKWLDKEKEATIDKLFSEITNIESVTQ